MNLGDLHSLSVLIGCSLPEVTLYTDDQRYYSGKARITEGYGGNLRRDPETSPELLVAETLISHVVREQVSVDGKMS